MAKPSSTSSKKYTTGEGVTSEAATSAAKEQSTSVKDAIKKYDKTFEENYAISSEFQNSSDPIREALRRYWIDYASNLHYYTPDYSSYVAIGEVTQQNGPLLDMFTYIQHRWWVCPSEKRIWK